MEQKKHNYRYFIVFICLLIEAIPYCITQNLQTQMQNPVAASGVVTQVGFTLLYLAGTIPALFNPVIARIYDKLRIKYVYVIGILLSCLAFASYGLAQNTLMFNISAFFTQLGAILVAGLTLPIMMGRWFPGEGRGTALGIVLAGSSLGNIFFQPITVRLLNSVGWRGTYVILGIIGIVIGIPLALLFMRSPRPDEVDVPVSPATGQAKAVGREFEGLSNEEISKDPTFWIFCVGCGLICFAVVALTTQAIPVLGNKGFTPTMLGTAGSIYGVACLLGNLVGGKLFDKYGSFSPMIISGVCAVIAFFIMAFMPEGGAVGYLIPVFAGFIIFTVSSAPAFMPADVFGHKDATMKLAKVGMFYAIGSSVSALLFTVTTNKFGLTDACLLFAGIGVIGYGLNLYAQIKEKHLTHHHPIPH